MSPAVHGVVVNWNAAAETLACLDSLGRSATPLERIHVVDNGSTDDSASRLRAGSAANVVLHLNERNEGFAAGANAGIRAALAEGADWVLLMNNDARVDPAAVGALLDAAGAHPGAGLFGGKIFRDRAANVLWCCGVAFRFGPNIGTLRGFDTRDTGAYDRIEPVDSLTGCGLLVRREVFERAGLLDESYFAYVEDADFARRARAAGFSCLYVPGAVFEHPGGRSTGGGYSIGRKYLTAHGAARFLRAHGSFKTWAGFLLFDLLLWPVLFVQAALRGEGAAARAKLRGTLDGLRRRPPDLSVLSRRR